VVSMKDDGLRPCSPEARELRELIVNLRTDIACMKGWHTGDYLDGTRYMRDAILRMIDSRLDEHFASASEHARSASTP